MNKQKGKRGFFKYLCFIVCLVLLSSCKKQPISMPFGISECKGKHYSEVVSNFSNLGFKKIETIAIEDVVLGIFAKENMVSDVSIGGNNKFKKGEVVYPNQNVIISYHVKKPDKKAEETIAKEVQNNSENGSVTTNENHVANSESAENEMIRVPLSAKDCKNKEYVIIENNFKDAGFTNVELTPIEDNSLFGKEGKVAQISINGNGTFKSGEQFNKNAKVRITYYAVPESYYDYEENIEEYEEEMQIVAITKKEDMIGTWIQTNSDEQRFYMAAIDENTITVYVYFVEEDDIQVYWTGTFDSNIDVTKKIEINSENYRFITDSMFNASHADVKTFIYENSKITFNVSYLGVSTDIVLEKDAEEYTTTIKLTGDREPGFNEATNNTVTMGNLEIQIPSYFDSKEETSTDDYVEYFSKENEAVAILYIQDYVLDEEVATEDLTDFVAYMFDSSERGYQILDMKELQINGISGVMVLYSTKTGLGLEAWYLVDGKQNAVIIGETFDYMDRTKHDYFTDFNSIVENVKLKGNNL